MEKKIYELTVVTDAKKTEKETKSLVEAALQRVGGRLVEFTFWGKKDLVRPIKRAGTVVMGFAEVEVANSKVIELATRLRMNDEVMRHMLVIKEQPSKTSKKRPKKSVRQAQDVPIINKEK